MITHRKRDFDNFRKDIETELGLKFKKRVTILSYNFSIPLLPWNGVSGLFENNLISNLQVLWLKIETGKMSWFLVASIDLTLFQMSLGSSVSARDALDQNL